MGHSLYTIAEDQRLINAMLEENGGELTPEIDVDKVLWEILHENGYYAPTLSNWNSQIR